MSAGWTLPPGRRIVGHVYQHASLGHGRLAVALTFAALLWSIAIVGGGLLLPSYSGESSSSYLHSSVPTTTVVTHTSSTFVEVNGNSGLILLCLPVLLVGVAWLGLHRKCSRGSLAGETTALIAMALAGGLAVLGIVTFGLFVLPVPLLLGLAISQTPLGNRV